MNCQGCVYYRYEPDTNANYCSKDEDPDACLDYYSIEDAKADNKYGNRDYY